MIDHTTKEALAFGLVLVLLSTAMAIGFNTLASGGVAFDAADVGLGSDDAGEQPAEDHGAGGHHGGDGGHGDGGHHGDGGGMNHDAMQMRMVENGTVINGNQDARPPGCREVAGERSVTIHGGFAYAEGGEMFSFDRDRLELEPCTRVTVTFVNEDEVRHQWMLHGLPRATYPMGMFNIEVDGPGRATGTFITPAENVTLNSHCSLPQHEQKGMQMKVVVGEGGQGGEMDH